MVDQLIGDLKSCLNKMNSLLYDFDTLCPLLADHPWSQIHVVQPINYTTSETNAFQRDFELHHSQTRSQQQQAMDEILASIQGLPDKKHFILLAATGTGKTFMINTIIEWCQSQYKNNTAYISMASTALGAQLLYDGHTTHPTLKLPIKISSGQPVRLTIKFDSKCAEQLCLTKVIFLDEAFSL
jgi:hypothetical protein